MLSNFVYHQSLEIGISRTSTALIFGKLLKEYKEDNKTIGKAADSLLEMMTIEELQQVSRDYTNYIIR